MTRYWPTACVIALQLRYASRCHVYPHTRQTCPPRCREENSLRRLGWCVSATSRSCLFLSSSSTVPLSGRGQARPPPPKLPTRSIAMASGGDGGDGGGLVCVTGGSGFIGSWLVRLLLGRGYTVHATVKNLQDEGDTKHLRALDAAGARLRLFQMDLLDPASVRPAVEGARGVFHLASPVILHPTQDPEANSFSRVQIHGRTSAGKKISTSCFSCCFQKELLEPAVKGTLGVLRAAKDCGVGRLVMVSSQTAMVPNPRWPAGKVIDEDSWADVDRLKKLPETVQDRAADSMPLESSFGTACPKH